jgi:pilus assembly protein TadC
MLKNDLLFRVFQSANMWLGTDIEYTSESSDFELQVNGDRHFGSFLLATSLYRRNQKIRKFFFNSIIISIILFGPYLFSYSKRLKHYLTFDKIN